MGRPDRPTLEAVLAPEWSVTDASGQVLTKEQYSTRRLRRRSAGSTPWPSTMSECACSVMSRLPRGGLGRRGAIEVACRPWSFGSPTCSSVRMGGGESSHRMQISSLNEALRPDTRTKDEMLGCGN